MYWIRTYVPMYIDSDIKPEYRRPPSKPVCPFCHADILHTDGETKFDFVNEYARLDIQDGASKLDK